MKLINLFEIFDPSNSIITSLNWLRILIILMIIPYSYWIIPNRSLIILYLFINYIFYEFKLLTSLKYKINIFIFFNLIIIILIINFIGLFPYIFTSTSQISINLSIALTLWIRFFIYRIWNKPLKTLAHLVPQNTPTQLINFISLIEFIRKIIQPWTLSIRLTANIIAGHLLLSLLRNFIINYFNILPLTLFSILIQNILLILEISVSIIQSYVFSILSLLYFIEIK